MELEEKSIEEKPRVTFQSIKEEIANSITHGIGAILSIIALVVLLYSSITRGSARHIVSCSFFGGALIILYVISTLYHAITHEGAKKVLRRLDHISIYFLIFATYMPITLVVLHGALSWLVFGLECGFCVLGICFKAIFGPKFEVLSTLFYLLMGCLALIVIKPIYDALSFQGMMYILYGGIFYILGIIFFALDKKIPFFHSIWHLFVLMGSFFHFFLVLLFIIPFGI